MATTEELEIEVRDILAQTWSSRDGQVAPNTEDVTLTGGAVKMDATLLYADLADSTELAMYNRQVAAKVFKAYLMCVTRLIRGLGGAVRSFDGDRVMGVFVGGSKNTAAAKCGLQVNYIFQCVIVPKLKERYEKLRDGSYGLAQTVGIDTSEVLVVRSGIRANNDLVWVGRAPNIAAKLSGIREDGYSTYVTKAVFDKLADESKYGGDPRRLMWEARSWNAGKALGVESVYRSNFWWKP
jgi:class 3 adenylate cyclase